MKNWTVTFYVPYRLGSEKLYTKINGYVSAETGAEAERIAECKACKEYEHPVFWGLDECAVSPTLADALDRFMSEEHEESADDLRYASFDSVYSDYADRVREWWMNHPKELYDWYDVTLPEGFEL